MRILSGIQPSGKLHLGNYFGMMRPSLELQKKGDAFLFIANYHALTTVHNSIQLRQDTLDVALDFLACGLDPQRTIFFRQSDVPEVLELTWLLSTVTPMGLLERCHSYKDKIARGIAANHALFAYPVLMAADILIYQSDIVPVGRDQKQHLEVTRDIALKFNNEFGEVFKIPEPFIPDEVAVIPGVDGQKMSKSYGNTIDLFASPKETKASIMRIVTDSTPLKDPKDPTACNVFALYKLFATEGQKAEMEANYRGANYGYGHAKKALLSLFTESFEPFRAKRAELASNLDYVEEVLQQGAAKARAAASVTLDKARAAVGL
ncbi:MAG: tryptophan--tRNA ligase [Kiritimatiellia bacterium]